MPNAVSPIVITREIDVSFVAPAISTTITAMVGGAMKGPINDPQFVTTPQQFIETFGEPILDSYMGYAALLFLQRGNQLWVNRVGSLQGSDPVATATTDTAAALASNPTTTLTPSTLGGTTLTVRFDFDSARTGVIVFPSGITTIEQVVNVINTALETGFEPRLGYAEITGVASDKITLYSNSKTGVSSSIEVLGSATAATALEWYDGTNYSSTIGTRVVKVVTPGTNASLTGSVAETYDFSESPAVITGVTPFVGLTGLNSKSLSLNVDNKGQIIMNFSTVSDPANVEELKGVINNSLVSDSRYGALYANFATSTTVTDAVGGGASALNFTPTVGYPNGFKFTIKVGGATIAITMKTTAAYTNIAELVLDLNTKINTGFGDTIDIVSEALGVLTISTQYGFELIAGTGTGVGNALTEDALAGNGLYLTAGVHGTRLKFTSPNTGAENSEIDVVFGTVLSMVGISTGVVAGTGDATLKFQINELTYNAVLSGTLQTVANVITQLTTNFNVPSAALENSGGKLKIKDPSTTILGSASHVEIIDGNTQLGFTAGDENDGTDVEIPAITFTASSPGTWANSSLSIKVYREDPLFFDPPSVRLEVYYAGALVETYRTLNITPTSDNYIETIVNGQSDYITVYFAEETIPPSIDVEDCFLKPTNTLAGAILISPYTMTGGANGLEALSSDEIIGTAGNPPTGLQVFANNETIFINLLTAPGFSDTAVILELLRLCEARGDCMAVVDPPIGLKPSEVVDWHNGVGNLGNSTAFNSSYGAVYSTWMKYFDSYNNAEVWLPPSCFILPVIAYNDSVAEAWYAPAGLIRGIVRGAMDVQYNPTFGERELMYGNGNAVNPIVNFPQDGIVVWGQRTLQRLPSSLDRINVRRLMLVCRTVVKLAAKVILFEPNDKITRDRLIGIVNPLLNDIANRRGIQRFQVVDATTDRDIQLNQMVMKIFLQPTQTVEIIDIPFIITAAGVSFGA